MPYKDKRTSQQAEGHSCFPYECLMSVKKCNKYIYVVYKTLSILGEECGIYRYVIGPDRPMKGLTERETSYSTKNKFNFKHRTSENEMRSKGLTVNPYNLLQYHVHNVTMLQNI